MQILTNSQLDYIIFVYSSYLQNFKVIKVQQLYNQMKINHLFKLTCILWTYRSCNSTVGFSKYEFNNKLLDGVMLLRVTSCVT